MKKLFTIIAAVLITAIVFAQTPQKMSYQAVVRKTNGDLVKSSSIGMRVSILRGSTTGAVVYQEIYNPNPQTNVNGLVSIEIGSGAVLSGKFDTINWGSNSYFIKIETDPVGGSSYTITSTSQLLSVPYALYAAKSGNSFSGNYNDLTNKPTTSPTHGSQFFASSGTFTVPAGITTVWVTASGAGGGGGGGGEGCMYYGGIGGAGGGGICVIGYQLNVTPLNNYTITINAGGAGGTGGFGTAPGGGGLDGAVGYNGGNSSFGNLLTVAGGGGGTGGGASTGAHLTGAAGTVGSGNASSFFSLGRGGAGGNFGTAPCTADNSGGGTGAAGLPGFVLVEW